MRHSDHPGSTFSAMAIATAVLWGLIELVALWRSRWAARTRHQRG